MGTKVGLKKPVESRGLDFSSSLTFEFDASNQRTFDHRSVAGLGTTVSAAYSTIDPVRQLIFQPVSNGAQSINPAWVPIPNYGYISSRFSENKVAIGSSDTRFELNHSKAFTLICVLQYTNNSNYNKYGFVGNIYQDNPYSGWSLYPESATKITFVLANDLYFGGRRIFASTGISWGDYGKEYFSQNFAGVYATLSNDAGTGLTYASDFNGTFDFTSPSTFFPLQTSTAYKFRIYLSQKEAELQTGTGTTILRGPIYIGNNGQRANQVTFTASWIPGTGSSITHWNAGKGNLSNNVDFGYTLGTNAGGGPSWSFNHRRWLHYAITYDGSAPTTTAAIENAYKIYLQGSAVGTSSVNSANFATSPDISYDPTLHRFGFFMDSTTNGFNRGLVANIGFCQIYNRVLTATEITTQYNTIKNRFGLP